MSSKEKKIAAAAEEAKKNKKFYTKCIIFIVCLAILVAAAAVINSNLFNPVIKSTALEIGGTEYSPAEFNYFYRSAISATYEELYSYYGDLTAYLLDTATPLSEQVSMYGDGEQTWADYFYNQTILTLTSLTVLYDRAVEEGYTLSAEDKEAIEAEIAAYEQTALSNNYESLKQFLALNFGDGFSVELLRDIAERQYLANAYAADLNDSFTFTAEEKDTHYAENKDDYDFYTYHVFMVGSTNANFSELETDEEKLAAAHDAAVEIANAASGAQFAKNVQNFVSEDSKAAYEDETVTKYLTQGLSLSETYKEWIIDASRVEGDTTVIDTESGSYAILYVGRDDNHYPLVNTRHILVSAVADENGVYTEEALQTAKAEAERIHELWLANPTAEYFAELAGEYSEDAGSNANGGLYEQVYKNYMVTEYNDFLFNQGNQPGDSAVIYGTNGNYEGYHVVYFDSVGEVFSDVLADGILRQDAYNEVMSGYAENYEVAVGEGMEHASLD
ncbi:MAG: peptidylprolyl isomerase [Oscillospiraceae bacterium]|nr:peptidylprolyl isomerase [Oscillospiraceae bacterium]